MNRILLHAGSHWLCLSLLLPGFVLVEERVVFRAGNGRFLRATEHGPLQADRLLPAEDETFGLVRLQEDHIALKAHDGRSLAAEGPYGRTLGARSPGVEPGDRETFQLFPVGGNRTAMKARNCRQFILFHSKDAKPARGETPGEPADQETVAVYHADEVPAAVRTTLALVIQNLVMAELADEEYSKVRTRKKEKYINLPAPTWRHPKRTKRHRILSITQEYHVRARLDGSLEIEIERMPYLKGYFEDGTGLMMFLVRARVPVTGRVRYKIPDALSASTGFRTIVRLSAVGEVRAEKSDGAVALSPPELLNVKVELRSLDLSNDLLHVARHEIEDLVNDELHDRKNRIRDQANKSIRKALESDEFQHPLFQYLGLL